MKKFLITLFTILYCANSALAEVETNAVLSPDAFVSEVKRLTSQNEIDFEDATWKQWYAHLLNLLNDKRYKAADYSSGGVKEYLFYINKNKEISDIVILFAPKMSTSELYILKDNVVYAYHYKTDQFYKMTALPRYILFGGGRDLLFLNQIEKFKVELINEKDEKALSRVASKMESEASRITNSYMMFEGILAFPKTTNLTKVRVHYATVPTSSLQYEKAITLSVCARIPEVENSDEYLQCRQPFETDLAELDEQIALEEVDYFKKRLSTEKERVQNEMQKKCEPLLYDSYDNYNQVKPEDINGRSIMLAE